MEDSLTIDVYSPGQILGMVTADLAVLAVIHALIGGPAPRWPQRWLTRDVGPLRFLSFETPNFYRKLHVPWLARHLPEAGDTFGGESKSQLPGNDPAALQRYLVEVRRGEWVHWLSMPTWIVLIFLPWNTWGLIVLWAFITVGINLMFLSVLRYNRLRIERILHITSERTQA
ncbi:MAG: hypothetical protein WCG77_02930 [Actinomycetes bacterium]